MRMRALLGEQLLPFHPDHINAINNFTLRVIGIKTIAGLLIILIFRILMIQNVGLAFIIYFLGLEAFL